jgi:putative endonuclease
MFKFYIVYSKNKDRYFLGVTTDLLQDRVDYLNTTKYGYTSSASDWTLVYFELFKTKEEAHNRKTQVKAWKSRVLIEKLINEQRNYL